MLALLVLLGCPGPEIANPTGECVAEDDGGRLCYHAPEADDTYLPDCEAPLAREYWRVFAQGEDSAYVMPRPDGSTAVEAACADEDAVLSDLLDTYTLCGSPDVDTINDMAIADALFITHALHARLVFVAVDLGEGSGDVDPFLPMDDVLAICRAAHDAILDTWCGDQEGRVDGDSCNDMGILMTAEEAEAAAAAANALYGIGG